MVRLSRSVALAAGFLSLAGTSASQQLHHVWVVNAPSQLQSAVDSAAEGDTVLVKASGDYGLFVQAKSLTVIADPPADVRIWGAEVKDLTAAQRVELRGLRFIPVPSCYPYYDPNSPGLSLLNNEGSVWVEDCMVAGSSDRYWCETATGTLVDRCTNVVLLRTRTEGTSVIEPLDSVQRGHGLVLRGNSRIVAHGCTFQGANGYGPGDLFHAVEGAAGLLSESPGDRVFLSDCQATGGDGAYGNEDSGPQCSRGGPGISSAGVTWTFDSQAIGGSGGSGWGCFAPAGPAFTGNVQTIPGQALRFSITAPVREGQSYQLDFHGPPGTPIWFLMSPSPRLRFRPLGPLLLEMPTASLSFAGVTDAAGVLQLTRTMPAMPPGLELGRLYAQAFYPGPWSRSLLGDTSVPARMLGGASMFLALDQSF